MENLTLTGSAAVNGTGNALNNVIQGNAFANQMAGETGNDTIVGFGGDDTLDGGAGVDSLVGGTGNDTYVIDSANDVIVELASQGTDTVISAVDHTLGTNFENLTLSGTAGRTGIGNIGANVMIGNAGSNRLEGLDGNDTLDGGAGADTLNGGSGADAMTGGAGNDTFIIDNIGDTVFEALDGGIDTIDSLFTTVLADNFENLILSGVSNINGTGNAAANRLTGNSGNNQLSGGLANDSLYGGGGNDVLSGDGGDDSMVGGAGDDTYYVDSSADKVVELSLGGFDRVFADANFVMGTGIEDLTMLNSGDYTARGNTSANTITGNAGNNTIKGSGGADTLVGNAGNDLLDGGAGNDSMTGGAGDDTYVVNSRGDQVIEVANGGIDTVRALTNWTLGDGVENLVFNGGGAFRGVGNALDNEITGNKAKNTLLGNAGMTR